ncbi:MAG: lipopolysaccharide biosynthesis protein [Synergistaceae bacterium]|nr:lipopolysaccharide biosynthesis protein [Candidatus Equadaptatus faecalis]
MPSITSGIYWKLLERFGVSAGQFVLQVVLARLLCPADYGALAIMIIFTALANIFVQSGFNTALIQNKDVTDEDYSSVFWVSLGIACVLYGLLFAVSPLISDFYNMPLLTRPFRILALMLIPGALNSVQLAKISREMDFKKVFYSNVAAVFISGALGIAMAYCGFGLWALVAQSLGNVVVACIVMWFTVKWRPVLVCNFHRIQILFAYGWKLLVSALLDTLYQDLQGLVIGKKYNAEALAYFNRGKQFPQFLMGAINGAIMSVMLPAMSLRQDEKSAVKALTRKSMTFSAFIIFPLMAGLAGVARPLVQLLLTDKWLPCVPYLQIYCFIFAFWPVHTCNLQAINAVGRSDLFLKLEIIKKSYGIVALTIAVLFFDTPIYIALTGVITTMISCFVNASPNKKLIGYSYFEQVKDIVPIFSAAMLMFFCVLALGKLQLNLIFLLFIQTITGIITYTLFAALFRIPALFEMKNMAMRYIRRDKR